MFYKNWEPVAPPARFKASQRVQGTPQHPPLTISVSVRRASPTIQRWCQVPGCPNPLCKLRTHRRYRHHQTQQDQNSIGHAPATSTASGDYTSGWSDIQVRSGSKNSPTAIIARGVEGLPALPLDGLELPRVREFFHAFFATGLPHLLRLTAPPPVTDLQKRAATDFERASLAAALTSPFVCLLFVTAVYVPTALREGDGRIDRSGTILQGKLMSLLRTKLANVKPAEAPDIASAIFAITLIELAADRFRSLDAHRNAMKSVVDKMGGLHNMGYATRFIAVFDRMTSHFSYAPMLFPLAPGKRMRRPIQHPQVYGSFFDTFCPSHGIAKEIVEFCADNCRLIELLEATGFSFGPVDPSQIVPSDIHYLYYFREGQMNDFILLNQRTAKQEDIYRCMLMASEIVYYFALHDNFILMVPFRWANIIRTIVSNQVIDMSPINKRILTWIMFVLATMPASWTGRQWASNYLKELLDEKYVSISWPADWEDIGELWPGNWRDIELENVRSFTWLQTQLHDAWNSACNELDGGALATPDWAQFTRRSI